MESNKTSRVGAWVHKNIVCERLKDLDNGNNTILGLKIGFPHKTKFKAISYYRQFKPLNQKAMKNDKEELKQFEIITKKIAKYLDENEEVIFASDINIDTKALDWEESLKTQTMKAQE